jgi:hypothetical protein
VFSGRGSGEERLLVLRRLEHALVPDETTRTPIEKIHDNFVKVFPLPPNISAPATPNDMATHISRVFPDIIIQDETGTPHVKAKLQPVDFDKSADIWARAGYDLTMWVLQYVQSQISSHKRKADKVEGVHGLVGTGVSLTVGGGGGEKAMESGPMKQEDQTEIKADDTANTKPGPGRPSKAVGVNDKIPDSGYTLLSTSGMPYPQLSIRKNFRTMVTASAEHTIAPPPGVQSADGNPNTTMTGNGDQVGATEQKVQEVLQRQMNIGKYCPQVLGHEGSVRVAKSWQVEVDTRTDSHIDPFLSTGFMRGFLLRFPKSFLPSMIRSPPRPRNAPPRTLH